MNPTRSRTIISLFASLVLGTLTASPALGALSASPNPSTTGSYTVSGSESTSATFHFFQLHETGPDDETATYRLSDISDISESFSGKAVGTYTYKVQGCRTYPRPGLLPRCTDIGDSLSVTVSSPPADPMPDFGDATVSAKNWKQNTAVTAFTVPAATGGDAPLSYSASGLPSGVSMNASRSVSGTPTAAGMGTATVTVSDNDGDTDTLDFTWSVAADLMPTFGMSSVSAKSWKQNSAITAFTVPAATGGDGTLTYAADGLPDGVSMSSSRSVSGTPTGHGTGTVTVTVTDSDGDTATLDFAWTVAEDLMPDFGDATVSYRSWVQNSAITAFTVPAATGGDGTLSYTASGLPSGVTMSSARQVSGTPTAAGVGIATVTVTDADGDTDTLRFTWNVGADLTPTFGTATIADKTFKQNASITAFYVPLASSGNPPRTYTATGLPAGVSVENTRRVSGTPTGHGMGTATVTVTDSDGDTDTLDFDWTVNEDLMPSFGEATVSEKTWTLRTSITAFTVPAASGGDGTLRYSVSGLPSAVWMSTSTRQVSGRPLGNDASSGTATVTVKDADGDTDTLSFDWSVADPMPDFGTASVSDKTWTQNTAISRFTAPAASGGNSPVRYSASGLPAGVTMSSLRRVSGTPTGHGTGTATITATDYDGDTDTLDFDWTVNEDLMPSFGTSSVPAKTWTQNGAITAFTVAAATGGDGTLTYSASDLPTGVSMSSSREVSGTPTGHGTGTATVTATDSDGDTATLDFGWTVNEDLMPTFGTSSVPAKTWTQNGAITAFTVAAATGGDGTLTYSASGLPTGVSMSNSREVSGTPTGHGMGTATVTATDSDGDTGTLDFDWTVNEDLMPSFGNASVSAKSWTLRTAVTAFTVPAATGGDGTLTYSVSGLPSAVSMSTSTRQVSGTPLGNDADSGTATVTARDADGDTATLDFDWTVTDPMPDFATASVPAKIWRSNAAISSFTVPAARGGNSPLSYSATGLPAGVTMSSARSVSGTPAATGTGTATVTVTDVDGDTDTLSFGWTVEADLVPTFGSTVPAKYWLRQAAIPGFTIPKATGGNPPLSYTVTGLPSGVVMSSARAVSGTPTATGSGTATVTVTDVDGDTDKLSFGWTVYETINPPPSPPHKRWLKDQAITAFTVPVATGGVAPLTYSASGLPIGVTMSSSRTVSGTPTSTGSGTATITVTDANSDTGTVSFTWNVETDTEPTFGSASISAKTWAPNQAITAFTAPAATGGNTPLSYTATGLPAGVTMSSARSVSGTPTAAGSGTATVTVTDFDGDTDTLRFSWSVVTPDRTPDFGTASVGAQGWTANQAITAFTVPAATSGDGTLTYSATGLPYGVTMSTARQVSGTPLFASSGTATVTARDADGDTDTLSFAWTVSATDLMPDYSSASVSQPSWARNQAIVGLTVPAASGGNTPLSYTASGLPAGIAMSTSRVLSGTPTSVGTGTATVTVTDADGDTATFTFNWAVVADDLTPSFGSATIAIQSWVTGKDITAFAAPAATGGNAPLVHGIAGLPAGVVMLNSMQIQGTPTAAGSGTATVAARDADGDLVKVSFNWTVTANAQPSFGTSTVSSQSWTAGRAITALTVPSATGGNGTLSYGAAGLPEGVTLSPTLQLSGTPLATGSGTATVTARDSDGDTATLTFNWTATFPAGTGTVLSVSPNPPASANYTVSGAYTGTKSYIYFTLFETNPWGHVTRFHHASVPFSQSIANRVDGAYTYRLEGCYLKQYQNYPEAYEVCETVGDTLAVTVDGPDPDSVGTQLGYTFQARVNSTNPAQATAIFIDRTSSATGGGVFQDIVLRKSGNAFELVDPGSVTGTAPGSWSTTTAVDLVLSDINLDGFVDVLVRGLGGAITGALDQIVYAPGRSGGSPVILNAVDSSLTNFLSEVSSWTRDPTYFQRHQEPGEVTVTVYRPNCFNAESRRFCSSIPTVVIEVSGARPTNKSSEAREFAQQFSVVSGRIDPTITPGSLQATNITRILESVFGAKVLNDNLLQSCGSRIECQSEIRYYTESILVNVEEFWQIIDNTEEDADGDGVIEPGEFRRLTPSEESLIGQFGYHSGIDLKKIKVYHQPKFHTRPGRPNTATPDDWFTGGNMIAVSECDTDTGYENQHKCFQSSFSRVTEVGVLMHELTHVWQTRNGIPFRRRDTTKYEGGEYDYRLGNGMLEKGKDFLCYTREQQAEMIGDLYRLMNGETAYQQYNRHGSVEVMKEQLMDKIGMPPLINDKPEC